MDPSKSFDELSVEEGVQPTTMASHSDILDSSNNQNPSNKDKNENVIMVQTLESLVNFPETQEEKENSQFAVSMTNQKENAHVQKEIEKRTGIKPEDQTILTINWKGKVLKCKEINTDSNHIIVYNHCKYLCVKIIPTDSPKIMLVQFEKTDTMNDLSTYLDEWGLLENDEKMMMKEEGDMDGMDPGRLLETLLPADSDELLSIKFESSLSRLGKAKGPKKEESIVLNYDVETHNKQKIEKATQILSVAFECHPLAKKVFQSRIKVRDGQFLNTRGDINEEEDIKCFRNIVAELTSNDEFIELVYEKVVWEHKFGQWRDTPLTPVFKDCVKSLFLEIPNMELVHKVYKSRSNKKYPLWSSQPPNIENYRNSLPNIRISRNSYESQLHTGFLCNIKMISGADVINYCRMGRILPGDAIYIFHRRLGLGDYAHVILYTGLQKSGTDVGPDHPAVKATKDMLHCVHLKAVGISKMILNVSGDVGTIACESLSKAILNDAECFVVRGSEDGETRRRFVQRAFQLTEPRFTFDYDAKGGNCESVISAIWEIWDNLTPQGETIENPDGSKGQKILSKMLRFVNTVSLKDELQKRL